MCVYMHTVELDSEDEDHQMLFSKKISNIFSNIFSKMFPRIFFKIFFKFF